MKKKIAALALSAVLAAAALTGCGEGDGGEGSFDAAQEISLITREETSGTRGAFVELVGLESKDADGNTIDNTSAEAVILKSTQAVISGVAGDAYAIGYISLGSLNDTVKAVKVEGVEAAAENVANGTYVLARPFTIATKDNLSDAAQDFIHYILSDEGKRIIEEEGYVSVSSGSYESNGASGTVNVSGSTSVTPLMEKLIEAYADVNANVSVKVDTSDSSTGVSDTIKGISDIGMASRELKDSETAEGVTGTTIAQDGIAVIVNQENTCENLTEEQIKNIYLGDVTAWETVAG